MLEKSAFGSHRSGGGRIVQWLQERVDMDVDVEELKKISASVRLLGTYPMKPAKV